MWDEVRLFSVELTCSFLFEPLSWSGSPQLLSSEENYHSTHSSQSDSQYGSPPRGWSEELDEHGHTLYVSEYTQEKVEPPAVHVCLFSLWSWWVFVLSVDKACGWTGTAVLLQRRWIQVRVGAAKGEITWQTSAVPAVASHSDSSCVLPGKMENPLVLHDHQAGRGSPAAFTVV